MDIFWYLAFTITVCIFSLSNTNHSSIYVKEIQEILSHGRLFLSAVPRLRLKPQLEHRRRNGVLLITNNPSQDATRGRCEGHPWSVQRLEMSYIIRKFQCWPINSRTRWNYSSLHASNCGRVKPTYYERSSVVLSIFSVTIYRHSSNRYKANLPSTVLYL